jgi:hypothetical protein
LDRLVHASAAARRFRMPLDTDIFAIPISLARRVIIVFNLFDIF